MKKTIKIIFLFVFISTLFLFPQKTEAGTLREAYAHLASLEQNATNTANKKQLTEKEIRDTNEEVNKIYNEIEAITIKVTNLQQEIATLQIKITDKDQEIKDLSKYFQISNGESAYLQYAFGSETLSEFVYRMAVIQELNDYNSKLIENMKTVIKESEAKTIELNSKQQQLDSKKGEYLQKLRSLGEVKEELEDTYTDIKQDIAESKLLLAYYEKVGCKMDDDLDTCAGTLPYNASYKLPVSVIAKISSDFGPRYVSGCRSCSTFHYGADIAVGYGTVLYPIANGIVTSISGANDRSTAAGLSLTIIYNIKGSYYTSTYAHLSEVLTSVGKVVSVNSVVAKSGNSGSSTTGAHLHFGFTKKARYVSSGLYGIPSSEVYTSYTAYKNNSFANNCTDYSVCESKGYKGIIENYYYFPYGAYTTGR